MKKNWIELNYPEIKDELTSMFPHLGYSKEAISCFLHDLPDIPTCPVCNTNKVKLKSTIEGFHTYCSPKCQANSKESIEKKSRPVSKETLKKREETMLAKYGVKHSFESKEITSKYKKTLLEKYGVEHNSQITSFKKSQAERIKIVNKKRHDVFMSDLNSYFEKSGVELIESTENEYKLREKNTGIEYWITKKTIYYRRKRGESASISDVPAYTNTSRGERELQDWIESLGVDIVRNDKSILGRKEIDVYVHQHSLAVEFNGLYYHSDVFKDKYYHREKYEVCKAKDIHLIQIWEDDWMYKKDIVKDIISRCLGMNNKIGGRKCNIKEVSCIEERSFLESNHLQGYTPSSICYGLYYDDELIQLLSIRKPRYTTKFKWEVLRFCTKKGISVMGGLNKLIKHFTENNNTCVNEIVSYVDRSYFTGNEFERLGISSGSDDISYWWVINGRRLSRQKFTKKKLGLDENITEDAYMKSIKAWKVWGV